MKERYLTDEETAGLDKRKCREDKCSTEKMVIYFILKMAVTEQLYSYGFMAYVAECGGFVGLFLGFSLLQLEEIIMFFEWDR